MCITLLRKDGGGVTMAESICRAFQTSEGQGGQPRLTHLVMELPLVISFTIALVISKLS